MNLPTFVNIGIGLIFIYLLLSLLASEIQEIISSILELRAKRLNQGIQTLLSDTKLSENSKITNLLYKHSLISALNQRSFFGQRKWKEAFGPSYIPAETFSIALLSILNEKAKEELGKTLTVNGISQDSIPENTEKVINDIKALGLSDELRDNLISLVLHAERNTTHFREEIEKWFDRSMERASGSYKRDAKVWAIFIGFCIAISTNADTLNIVSRLSKDKAISTSIDAYILKEREKKCSNKPECLNELTTLIDKDDLTKLSLPIGWESSDPKSQELTLQSVKNGLIKSIGWLLTGIAISMGSSFWFDILNKFINVRYTGSKPAEADTKK